MSAQLQKGETFATGESVTAARLNALVDSGIAKPGIITELGAGTPVGADKMLVSDTSAAGALIGPTITTILALQLSDQAVGTPSMRTLGTGATQAAPGDKAAREDLANVFTANNQFCQVSGTYLGVLAIAAGAGLGTGGSVAATLDTNSTGLYGRILLTTGSTGGTGTVATITLDKTFANAPFISIIPYNVASLSNQQSSSRITVGTVSATQFTITNTVALTINTNLSFNYIIWGI